MKSAPTQRFLPWSEQTFEELQRSAPEPLVSSFQISQGMVLSLLQGAQEHGREGEAELRSLIEVAQCPHDRRNVLVEQADLYIEALKKTDLVSKEGDTLVVSDTLQRDFLLMQDVTLFLVSVLPFFQWQYPDGDREYACAVLSLAEAFCESPKAVVMAQRKIARNKLNKKLKRKGVAYEERKARVSSLELELQNPMSDFILSSFNDFLKTHPWVPTDALEPKSVALELYQNELTFSEFIMELTEDNNSSIVRQEGLLLRYLTQVHKTLKHNVPEEFKTDSVLDVEGFLLSTINATDSSLLREWETLRALELGSDPNDVMQPSQSLGIPTAAAPREAARPETDLEQRALQSRVRVEASRLARHLARGEWEQAERMLLSGSGGEIRAWNADSLKDALRARGLKCSLDPQSRQVKLEENVQGWRVHVRIADNTDASKIAAEFEAFAPWPANEFEPLLEMLFFR